MQTDEPSVIQFLLSTEIIPLALRIMENGSELSKTVHQKFHSNSLHNFSLLQVATFILQKILQDDAGLAYICQTYERFSHVAMVLGKMVVQLEGDQSHRLLKHVIRCYNRLSDNPRCKTFRNIFVINAHSPAVHVKRCVSVCQIN